MARPGHIYRAARELTAGRGRDRYRSMYQQLAAIVTDRRTELGWSQSELAERCGTTQSAIARVEQGQRPPRVDTILGLAEALDCDIELRFITRSGGTGDEA